MTELEAHNSCDCALFGTIWISGLNEVHTQPRVAKQPCLKSMDVMSEFRSIMYSSKSQDGQKAPASPSLLPFSGILHKTM